MELPRRNTLLEQEHGQNFPPVKTPFNCNKSFIQGAAQLTTLNDLLIFTKFLFPIEIELSYLLSTVV